MTAEAVGVAARLKVWHPGRRLGTRLIFWMVVSSTLLSVLASAIQLYASYQRDASNTQESFDIVEQSFHSSLTTALWEFDFKHIEVILDGLVANQGVVEIELVASTGQKIVKRAETPDSATITKSFALTRTDPDGTETHLGDLRIGMTLASARDRLLSQFWTLLATNMTKTLLASSAMLILFYFLVSRHLRRIASFEQGIEAELAEARLSLNRRPPAVPDDLDLVVEAINTAQRRARASFASVDKLNRSLDRSNRELKRSNDELEQFAHIAAHDLQEPLRKICAFGQLLRDEYGEALDDQGREYIEFMVDASSRQQHLVKDLLTYSRVGAQARQFVPVDLNAVLKSTLEDLSVTLKATDGQVEVAEMPSVTADRSEMKQLFLNLIGNALKYRSPERVPRVAIRAETLNDLGSIERRRNFCRIYIEDNGIGFDQAMAEKIFEPFRRLHARADYEGTGIGLAIVRKILFHHGGTITAKGRPGHGSLFVVTLPIAKTVEGLAQ